MTISDTKKMIRLAIQYGMNKAQAFGIAIEIIDSEHAEKRDALERFRYEINAEEQRRNDGGPN